MPFYAHSGTIPNKRHVRFPKPGTGLYAEELFSTKGFSGPSSLLYHLQPPTATLDVHSWEKPATVFLPNAPLRNRHFQTERSKQRGNAVDARLPLLGNDDLLFSIADIDEPMEFFHRNADGDELWFIHSGSGTLETPFGDIVYQPHDHLVLPAGTVYRFQPAETTRALIYESRGSVEIPKHFRNGVGQFTEQAPYCERDFRMPQLREPIEAPGEYVIRTTSKERHTTSVVRNHPFDVIGWDGYCYPYAFNVDQYAPITGKLHQPPPAHATFEAPGAAFYVFVPRLIDYHPQAVPAPYHHSNVHCDEVLYYVSGDFLSRRGISAGSITWHPAGAPHGPHPGAVEASLGKSSTDELAVMLDTFSPLRIAHNAHDLEDACYFRSWM